MKREYRIEIANNGFIIRFDHEPNSFRSENLRIAKSLTEVMRIMKQDIMSREVDITIGDTIYLKKGDTFPRVKGVADKDVAYALVEE